MTDRYLATGSQSFCSYLRQRSCCHCWCHWLHLEEIVTFSTSDPASAIGHFHRDNGSAGSCVSTVVCSCCFYLGGGETVEWKVVLHSGWQYPLQCFTVSLSKEVENNLFSLRQTNLLPCVDVAIHIEHRDDVQVKLIQCLCQISIVSIFHGKLGNNRKCTIAVLVKIFSGCFINVALLKQDMSHIPWLLIREIGSNWYHMYCVLCLSLISQRAELQCHIATQRFLHLVDEVDQCCRCNPLIWVNTSIKPHYGFLLGAVGRRDLLTPK